MQIGTIVRRVAVICRNLSDATIPYNTSASQQALIDLQELISDSENSMTAFEFSHYGVAKVLSK